MTGLLFVGERPTLPELLRLRIPQQVGASYSKFGIFLLNDLTGGRLRNFEKMCQGDAEEVMLRILQEWLEGKGLPVLWEVLVQTLRDTELNILVDQIQAYKIPTGGTCTIGEREVYSSHLNLHIYRNAALNIS